jgi:hypothetical protein
MPRLENNIRRFNPPKTHKDTVCRTLYLAFNSGSIWLTGKQRGQNNIRERLRCKIMGVDEDDLVSIPSIDRFDDFTINMKEAQRLGE